MRFYLQYCLEGIEFPNNWGATNGTILHEVFEEYARGETLDWLNNIKEKFRKAEWQLSKQAMTRKRTCGKCPFAKIYGHDILCEAVGKDVNEFDGCPRIELQDCIKLAKVVFDADINPIDEHKIIAVEYPFEFTFDNGAEAKGYIDLISELDDDTVEIRDWKSAKKPMTFEEAQNDIQMKMYFTIVKHLIKLKTPPFDKEYKNIIVTLDFLRHNPISMVFDDSVYDETIEFLGKVKRYISRVDSPKILDIHDRRVNWLCRFCNIDACNATCMEMYGKTREEIGNE
jgi:hypothetical protein